MPEFEEIDWELVSDVKASQRRTQVLQALVRGPQMTGELSDELGLSTAWVRNQLKWLERHGLAEELTGKANYHIYRMTEEGEQIAEEL